MNKLFLTILSIGILSSTTACSKIKNTEQSKTPPIVYVSGNGNGNYNSDGNNDQIEINKALDFVANHDDFTTVYLKGPNTYWINDTIFISENTILEGDADAVIKLIDHAKWNEKYKPLIGQKGHALSLGLGNPKVTTGNITIRGFEIDGNREKQSEASGNSHYNIISLQNSYNITINDMYLHDNLADAIQVGYDLYGFDINAKFYNNRIHRSGHDGIYVTNSINFEIYNNIFSNNRTDAHIRTQNCNDFKIYNNIGGNDPNRRFSGGIGVSIQTKGDTPLDKAEIYDNYFYGKGAYHGIWLWQMEVGGDLETHKNVYIHDNIISWYKKSGIQIEGFQNTIIENNIIESDKGSSGGDGSGITFSQEKLGHDIRGFKTIVKNNIIINNPLYGISNQQPKIHTFISEGNNIYGNLLGAYHNTSSSTDTYNLPISQNLKDIYPNILSPSWKKAVEKNKFRGDLSTIQAKLLYKQEKSIKNSTAK